VKPTNLRLTAEQIIDLCDPIFAADATDDDADAAVKRIVRVLDKTVVSETEELRAALNEMLKSHRYRFPLTGICHCEACQQAAALINSKN
jgi:hypothetical protein